MTKLLLALPLLTIAACSNQSSAGEGGSPDAKIKPGEWRYDQEIIEITSPGMSAEYIERLKRKANAEVHNRCVTADEANKLIAVAGEIAPNCQIDNGEISGGKVEATMQCQDRYLIQNTVITGSYSAEASEVTATNDVSGSPNPLGNAKWVMRMKGTRIGDCAS